MTRSQYSIIVHHSQLKQSCFFNLHLSAHKVIKVCSKQIEVVGCFLVSITFFRIPIPSFLQKREGENQISWQLNLQIVLTTRCGFLFLKISGNSFRSLILLCGTCVIFFFIPGEKREKCHYWLRIPFMFSFLSRRPREFQC